MDVSKSFEVPNQKDHIHKNRTILTQCFTDKSFSKNLATMSNLTFSQSSIQLIRDQYSLLKKPDEHKDD